MVENYRHTVVIRIKDGHGLEIDVPVFQFKKEYLSKNKGISKIDKQDIFSNDIVKHVPIFSEPDLFGNVTITGWQKVFTKPLFCKKGDKVEILEKHINEFDKKISYRVECRYNTFFLNESEIEIIKPKFSLE